MAAALFSTAVDVSALTSGVAQISAGCVHACALTTVGGAKCWGYNLDGALGNGTFTLSPPFGIATPVDVSGLTSGVAALWDGEPIVGETIPSIFYEIVSRNSDKCLDVTYASTEAAASVIQWICHGGANQQWRLEPVSDGAVRIIAQHSGQVLDVYGGLLESTSHPLFMSHGMAVTISSGNSPAGVQRLRVHRRSAQRQDAGRRKRVDGRWRTGDPVHRSRWCESAVAPPRGGAGSSSHYDAQ